jgi:LTXXQ motif family protein
MQPRMPDGMMGSGMMGMMGEHVEGRIAFLRAELKITDAQVPQWNTFADALRANAKRMGEMRNTMGGMMGQGRYVPESAGSA